MTRSKARKLAFETGMAFFAASLANRFDRLDLAGFSENYSHLIEGDGIMKRILATLKDCGALDRGGHLRARKLPFDVGQLVRRTWQETYDSREVADRLLKEDSARFRPRGVDGTLPAVAKASARWIDALDKCVVLGEEHQATGDPSERLEKGEAYISLATTEQKARAKLLETITPIQAAQDEARRLRERETRSRQPERERQRRVPFSGSFVRSHGYIPKELMG